MDELALIDWLREHLPQRPDVLLGPGDDCALVDTGDCAALAVTVDTLLEGSHFTADHDPEAVGWKTLAVSLSDLAAMGCRPRWAVTGLGLRKGMAPDWAIGLARGLLRCAEAFGVSLVGGDITSGSGPVSISLTAFGDPYPGGPLRRDGAVPGDVLAVTGALGGSIRGRHLNFAPRVKESEWLCGTGAVRAMMDISDGVALDLRRLCRASGVGAELVAADLPVSESACAEAELSGRSALSHALGDGEDFELLLALHAEAWSTVQASWPFAVPLTRIGTVTGAEAGLLLMDSAGEARPLPEGGFIHEIN